MRILKQAELLLVREGKRYFPAAWKETDIDIFHRSPLFPNFNSFCVPIIIERYKATFIKATFKTLFNTVHIFMVTST